MYLFLSIIIAVIGIIMVFKPQLYFDITESWKSRARSDPLTFTFSVRGWAASYVC